MLPFCLFLHSLPLELLFRKILEFSHLSSVSLHWLFIVLISVASLCYVFDEFLRLSSHFLIFFYCTSVSVTCRCLTFPNLVVWNGKNIISHDFVGWLGGFSASLAWTPSCNHTHLAGQMWSELDWAARWLRQLNPSPHIISHSPEVTRASFMVALVFPAARLYKTFQVSTCVTLTSDSLAI